MWVQESIAKEASDLFGTNPSVLYLLALIQSRDRDSWAKDGPSLSSLDDHDQHDAAVSQRHASSAKHQSQHRLDPLSTAVQSCSRRPATNATTSSVERNSQPSLYFEAKNITHYFLRKKLHQPSRRSSHRSSWDLKARNVKRYSSS